MPRTGMASGVPTAAAGGGSSGFSGFDGGWDEWGNGNSGTAAGGGGAGGGPVRSGLAPQKSLSSPDMQKAGGDDDWGKW